jgi:hypothetical protein
MRKQAEFEKLRGEIEALQAEKNTLSNAAPMSPTP